MKSLDEKLARLHADPGADGELGGTEGWRSYHGDLRSLGIKPSGPLEQDLELRAQSRTLTDERIVDR
jgi:hypothetical protein